MAYRNSEIINIKPLEFVHVLNLSTNETHLVTGPNSLYIQADQKLLNSILPFVVIPPGKYVVVENPVVEVNRHGVAKNRHGYTEIRFHSKPFPLYPQERLSGAPKFETTGDYSAALQPIPVVPPNHALLLEATFDFLDGATQRRAGDKWQLLGPVSYKPVPEVRILHLVKPTVLTFKSALLLEAIEDFVDRHGVSRVSGEQWIVKGPCAYLQDHRERVNELIDAVTLTDNIALLLYATRTINDMFGVVRLAGSSWLLTRQHTETYLCEVGVTVRSIIQRTILNACQYVVVCDPVNAAGENQLGQKEVRVGVCSFFLQPGEWIEDGIKSTFLLAENEAILLRALNAFTEPASGEQRKPGDQWLLQGPVNFIPPVDVTVLETRKAIALDKNEGLYVRDTLTGDVRAVMGPCSYMLKAFEVLYEKELPDNVDKLLSMGGGAGDPDIRKMAYFEQAVDHKYLMGRDKTRVVTYRIPNNCAIQIYNYKGKTARVIYGPELAVLGPHENFNVLKLSAGKPKRFGALHSFCLMLGPDFMTDIITVETSDHARLAIKYGFNNHFILNKGNLEADCKIFSVPDFIGFACKQIAGRVRSLVAQTTFDEFHKNSAQIVKTAVFGLDANNKLNSELVFSENNLVVSSIDIESIEPVDVKMRDSLMTSVQMAIEISIRSTAAAAEHEARRVEQIARGDLERQILKNEKEAEKERTKLIEMQAVTAAVESCGQAKAEAAATAEKELIEALSNIEIQKFKAKAADIEQEITLANIIMLRENELKYRRKMDELELSRMKQFADIELCSFASKIDALGADTIVSMAQAGPAADLALLQGLGLDSVLITSGKSPVNLFNTAQGLLGTTFMSR